MRGRVERVLDGRLHGWVWDPENPEQRVTVHISVDGRLLGQVVGDQPRADLVRAGIGDGSHAFRVSLPSGIQDGAKHRFALGLQSESEEGGSEDSVIDEQEIEVPQESGIVGRVEGVIGGRINGWCWNKHHPDRRLIAFAYREDQKLAECRADIGRSDLVKANIGDGSHAFSFDLRSLSAVGKDGEVRIEVRDDVTGETLVLGSATITARRAPNQIEAPVDLLAEAAEAERAGDLATATQCLERLLEDEPDNVDVLVRRARVARAAGDDEHAKQIALRAASLREYAPGACVTLARVAETERDYALALEYWSRVPDTESAYRERLLSSARLLLALERPADAYDCLLAALDRYPGFGPLERLLRQLCRDNHYPLPTQLQRANDPSPVPTPASRTILRYRDALSAATRPVLLGVGRSLSDGVAACSLISALASHFDAPVDVVVPVAGADSLVALERHPLVGRLTALGDETTRHEVAFSLGEFGMDPATLGFVPNANLRFAYQDDRSPCATLTERILANRSWLEEVSGCSTPAIPSFALSPEPVNTETLDFTLVCQLCNADGSKCRLLARDLERVGTVGLATRALSASELLARVADGRTVVCNSEAVALLACAMGKSTIFVGTAEQADDLSRLGFNLANIVPSREANVLPFAACLGDISSAEVLQPGQVDGLRPS